MEQLIQLDGNILLFIQNMIRNPVLSPVMKAITHLGDHGIFWIVLTLLLLCFKRTRKIGICAAMGLLMTFLINNMIIKNLVNRTRPYEVVEGLQILIGKQVDSSFPSGHSGVAFGTAVAIALNAPKKYGIPLIILALLISLSRLYVGVHYPSDVLAGILIGTLVGIFGSWLGRRICRIPAVSKHVTEEDGF